MTLVHTLALVALAFQLAGAVPPQQRRGAGALVMLAGGGGLTAGDLREALAHEDPLMRLVAARLITVNRIAGLAHLLRAASERESDPRVAAAFAESLRLLDFKPDRPLDPTIAPPRLPPPWLPGQLALAAEAAGCRLEDNQFGVAEVTYQGDGRPIRIGLSPSSTLSKECSSVLIAIARTTLLDPFDVLPDGTIQWLLVPLSKAYAECTRELSTPALPFGVSRDRPPRIIRQVNPDYPADLLDKRIEGTVVATGVISSKGCLQELRVVQSVAFGLDIAALRAMSGWLFEPAQVDGEPVPVRVELSVKFTAK